MAFLCGSYHLFPSISLHLFSSWEKESRSLRDPYIDYSLTRASAKDGDVFILSFDDDDDIGQRKEEEEELNKRSFHSPPRRFLSIHKKVLFGPLSLSLPCFRENATAQIVKHRMGTNPEQRGMYHSCTAFESIVRDSLQSGPTELSVDCWEVGNCVEVTL